MASTKSLNLKKETVSEIEKKLKSNKLFLLLNYQGLTVSEIESLRSNLKKSNAEIKVYKNTLMDIALKANKIDLSEYMAGPNIYVFADDIIEPIKLVCNFAKDHKALEVRVGYLDNEILDLNVINTYATIPSMEGLLTMFAGGLIEHVKNLSIGLNMYAEKLEKEGGEA
ncbi:MAG: 50S ribosomal protein L10 [Bacilli bacterium]